MTSEMLQSRLDAAMPGTTIEVPDGSVRTTRPIYITKSGTESAPIVVRARNRGKAVIEGKAGIEVVGASHIVIEGLAFTHENRTPAVKLTDCKNVRVTRCRFRLQNDASKRQNWVAITGGKSEQNRIDHCVFEDLATAGAFIAVDGGEAIPFQVSRSDRIDYNHFRSIPKREGTPGGGARAIRLGWTKLAGSTGATVVEFNLFETCSGDEEIITVRSSGQTVRYNTFQNSAGHVTLRLGAGNTVEGNFFLNANKEGVGGVKVFGNDAKVFNNYFEDLTAPALILSNGVGEAVPTGNGATIDIARPAAKRAAILFNTWVNCGGGALEIGSSNGGQWPDAPTECAIANNVAIGFGDELIRMKGKDIAIKWSTNIMFHAVSKDKVGVALADNEVNVVFPKLRNPGGIWRLGPNSPAIDYAQGEYEFVSTDIDGQPRPKNKDAGCDEFATGPIKQRPFTGTDVGVEAP